MKRILKQKITTDPGIQRIEAFGPSNPPTSPPQLAVVAILDVDLDLDGTLCVWFVIDDSPFVKTEAWVTTIATGEAVPDKLAYVGTVKIDMTVPSLNLQRGIWHIYAYLVSVT